MGNNNSSPWLHVVIIALTTFILAISFSFFSELVLAKFQSIVFALALLVCIILVGIIFDMIGVAATAATDSPFHAKAAKKIAGAKQSLRLLVNADKVASFCNDVVGDICGTVSGALGAAIVFEIASSSNLTAFQSILSLIMTGLIAALTVAGKAVGKKLAINQAEEIIFRVGQVLAKLEQLTGIKILSQKKRRVREKV